MTQVTIRPNSSYKIALTFSSNLCHFKMHVYYYEILFVAISVLLNIQSNDDIYTQMYANISLYEDITAGVVPLSRIISCLTPMVITKHGAWCIVVAAHCCW